MMTRARRIFTPFRMTAVIALAGLLAACENPGLGSGGATGAGAGKEAPVPKADYLTHTDHFQSLQRAGLAGNYGAFAEHLKAADPTPVLAQLQKSFAGRPFDVYTAKSQTNATGHIRFIELRGTGGRLYLYVKLKKQPGGWTVGEYEMSRDRRSIAIRL